MSFNNPEEILEILLCSDKSYNELLDYCSELYEHINVVHKNCLGNEYFSKYTQCILECYKIIKNFSSSIWFSSKMVDVNSIKDNCKPIEFSRVNSKGEFIKYTVYNEDQIRKTESANEIQKDNEAINLQNNNILNDVDIEQYHDFKLRYLLLKALKNDKFTNYPKDLIFFIERFGLLNENVLTLEEMGNIHSLSRERIRQVVNRAFRKLKFKIMRATIENAPNMYELSQYLNFIIKILDSQQYDNQNEYFWEKFLLKEMGHFSSLYIELINKLTNKNYLLEGPKFVKLEDALISLDNIIENYKLPVYSANFIAEIMNIKNKKSVVANNEVNLPLNNFLYVYSTKRKHIFYKNIKGIGYLTKNIENLQNINECITDLSTNSIIVDNNIEKRNLQVKRAILSCIKEFSGKYGKSGIAKILKGSKGLKDNSYNNNAANSSFYGMFEQMTLSFLEKEIDGLIDKKHLKIEKLGNFGRPILSITKEGEAFYNKIQDINQPKIEQDEFYKSEIFINIANYIDKGSNIFITGHAGTGKSFILNKLKEKYKEIVITSTTGMAAVNVKGQTLHSWAGVGICNHSIDYTVKRILSKSSITKQICNCKILAIDEISMLNVATFEYVDKVLRIIRNCEKPYGGIQVILIGDFFQLPPVEKDAVIEKKYCFESPIWKELDLKNIILTKNYRQNEEDLIQALSNMRTNNLSKEDIKLLKTREIKKSSSMDNILHIYSTNEEADKYNNKMFNLVNSKEFSLISFDGIYKGKKLVDTPETERDKIIFNRIDVTCRAEKNIVLKIGVRVMLLVNLDFEKGLINGTCGIVEDICEDYILVLFDNDIKEKIKQHDFEFYNNNELIAVRRQYPLRLAYGITIHKSQGMSLDNLVVDCSKIFEKGQAYVALSRIKKLSGLYLYNFNPASVMVDEKVATFYKGLKASN